MWQKVIVLAVFPFIGGCTLFQAQEAAPVVSIGNQVPVMKGTHIVKAGETLYEIAWGYGRDYRDLAMANHISPPFVIYPGQKLTLIPPSKSQQNKANFAFAPASQPNITKKKELANVAAQSKTQPQMVFNNRWDWPVKGNIIQHFSTQGPHMSKGIDISGKLGASVRAAAPGKVVYSGSGLRGYGQLIIVKHNEDFLSAYAHNSRLLVKEGDSIGQGQTIAEMGHSDTDKVKLHFEIRKNGQPVNPLNLLPKRV